MKRVKLTPIQRHARKLYASMKRRIEEKKDKNGRIIRHGQPIPFTEDELVKWLEYRFGFGTAKTVCRYCLKPLGMTECAYDHEIPLSRQGSAGLENIACICHEDNQYKGKLTPIEYMCLKQLLRDHFCAEARADIEGRLKKATKLAASARWAIKKKAKSATV